MIPSTPPHLHSSSSLDPDLEDHIAREHAFDGVFAWPPEANATAQRPRFVLKAWSIYRESALRALVLPSAGDSTLDTALTALWLAAHEEDEIIMLRVQSLARQQQRIRDWCRDQVLVSEREALMALTDEIFAAADAVKTLPAHEGSAGSGNAPRL